MSEHIRRLRRAVGRELLLLPSVSVLPRDAEGRVLLVRQTDSGRWATIGGTIEADEAPRDAAVREAAEEAGVMVDLGRLVDILGGPGFRVVYGNGDEVAYVTAVFEATVTGGQPRPDHDETTEVGWFGADELAGLDLVPFTRATFEALGLIA